MYFSTFALKLVYTVYQDLYEQPHDKTNKMACAPSEDSDQPGHLPSLIRVFPVCMKKVQILSYPLSTQQRLIRLGGCPGWSEWSLGAHVFLLRLKYLGPLRWSTFFAGIKLWESHTCSVWQWLFCRTFPQVMLVSHTVRMARWMNNL